MLLVYLDNSLNIQALLVCPAMSGPASLSVIVLSCNFSQPDSYSTVPIGCCCHWPRINAYSSVARRLSRLAVVGVVVGRRQSALSRDVELSVVS